MIANRIIDEVSSGNLVLQHDGGVDRAQSVDALVIVLENLDAQGDRIEPMCQ